MSLLQCLTNLDNRCQILIQPQIRGVIKQVKYVLKQNCAKNHTLYKNVNLNLS